MASRSFGSWLLGGPEDAARTVLRRARVFIMLDLFVANSAGAVGAFVLGAFVLPTPDLGHDLLVRDIIGSSLFFVATAALSGIWVLRTTGKRSRWALEGRTPTPKEQRAALRMPAAFMWMHVFFWGLAVAVFGTLNALVSLALGLSIALAAAIGGALTAGYAYLLSEFALRPLSALALSAGPPPGRLRLPGVRTRVLFAWLIGSAVPVAGLMAVAIASLAGKSVSPTRFATTVLSLGGAVLLVGLAVLRLASRATADPIRGVREALQRVERGDLDVQIPVYDTSDVGQLQAGFNRMTTGLRERERMRDLFGRHVGEDVAHQALDGELELGGEVRAVGVLFVDLSGSTALAATQPAADVVALLNRFFGVVVDVVGVHGGMVNKFQGDAALVVFGAPTDHPDPAGAALAAGRQLVARLHAEVPEAHVGVGVSYGTAVAGNIGAESRYEYTVIGDAVNEAARLTELAKSLPGSLAASAEAVQAANSDDWVVGDEVVLRGRTRPTVVMSPA